MLTKSELSQEYRRLVAAFERIFGATIFFGTESNPKHARVIQRSRFNFLSEAQIWYNREPAQEVLSADFENVIVLSDEFYNEVIAHPIPADIEAVKAFGSAPAVLDLFMWLTYRCFTAKSEERIPLFGDFGLTAQLGSVEYSRPRRFRAMLEQWLGQVRAVWAGVPSAHLLGWSISATQAGESGTADDRLTGSGHHVGRCGAHNYGLLASRPIPTLICIRARAGIAGRSTTAVPVIF